MDEKTTGDLQEELMSQPDLDAYIHDNRMTFAYQNVAELLMSLYDRKNLPKAALARKAGISEVYLHQVFSGRRNLSRGRLLCICVGLEAAIEETQEFLKRAGCAPLYPRIKRDAIINHGLIHRTELNEINDKLFAENEKTLF